MPVDIPLSTSGAEATTIIPIKGSMSLLWLWHLTMSLCWRACSTITNQQAMIVVHQVLFNPSEPLATAMAPLFFHDDNNSCLEAGTLCKMLRIWNFAEKLQK
jgi:hypothetical protein